MNPRNKNTLYILLFFAMFAWGASWVNVKVLSNYINEFEMIFLRFSITALTMIPIIILLKIPFKIDLKSLLLAILTSVFFIAYMKYFFLGTKYGTASLGGAFVTSLVPINTFLFLSLLKIKQMKRKDYFALLLGALGVLTILNVWSFKLQSIVVIENLYFILASLIWPIVTILSSKATKISPLVFSFYLYVITCLFDIIFFVNLNSIDYKKFDSIFYINILSLSIFASTYANSIYFVGIKKLGASNVSSFIFLVPFFAISLSIIFLNEELNLFIIIGTIMTLYAVKILNNIKLRKNTPQK